MNSVQSAINAARDLDARIARDLERVGVKWKPPSTATDANNPLEVLGHLGAIYQALDKELRRRTGATTGVHAGLQRREVEILQRLDRSRDGVLPASAALDEPAPVMRGRKEYYRYSGGNDRYMRVVAIPRGHATELLDVEITPLGRRVLALHRARDETVEVLGQLVDALTGEFGLQLKQLARVIPARTGDGSIHCSTLGRWAAAWRDAHPRESLQRRQVDWAEVERLRAEGHPVAELAERFGVKPGTIMSTLSRRRKGLR